MDFLFGAILLTTILWSLYSLAAVIYLVWPFSTREVAAKSLAISVVLVGAEAFLFDISIPTGSAGNGKSALEIGALSRSAAPEFCGEAGVALLDVVAVSGEHVVRVSPDASAPKLKNEKASQIFKKVTFHQIDNSTTVRRICAQSTWTEIQIVTPDWLTHVRGWVPNEALREIRRSKDGKRIYIEDDFLWDKDTRHYKPQIAAVVNKITRENRNCSTIDTASIAKSPSRSRPGDVVFFVACGTGIDVFNVWFRPSDAKTGQNFVAVEPLGKKAAADACEQLARKSAINPPTVKFSRVLNLAYIPHASGRVRIVSTFTAKNNFDMELEYRISCLFEGAEVIETVISEAAE